VHRRQPAYEDGERNDRARQRPGQIESDPTLNEPAARCRHDHERHGDGETGADPEGRRAPRCVNKKRDSTKELVMYAMPAAATLRKGSSNRRGTSVAGMPTAVARIGTEAEPIAQR
jgi:hypothetical protein